MKKRIILLSSLIFAIAFIMPMSVALADDPPIWALDPTKHAAQLADYTLLSSNSSTMTDPVSGTSVSVYYQVWGGPAGCGFTPPVCTTILGIGYVETEIPITEAQLTAMKTTLTTSGWNVTDVTTQVPGAALAMVYNMSIFSINIWMGFALFDTMKHSIVVTQTSMPSLSTSGSGDASIELTASVGDSMTGLMTAAGTAAEALKGIPGYDLLIMLGLISVITGGILLGKRVKRLKKI